MFSISRKISIKDKVLFYESIANLLDGWVTLLSAFRGFISRLPEWNLKDAIENTVFFVESGDQLNIAMRKLPHFYTEKEIAIIESWEQVGMLKDVFMAIARELRMQEDLRRKVMWALTYPIIIMIFLVLAVTVIMVYVIPQIMPVIVEMATDLTFSTRSLIAVSDFLKNNIAFIIAFIIALILLFRGFVVTEVWKMWFDRFKIYNFVSGKVYKDYIIVQVMGTFHLLSSSGVWVVRALRLTGASSGNIFISSLYNQLADDISRGKKLSEAMLDHDKEHKIFTPDILQLIESSEKTSTTHQVVEKISNQYRRELDASLAMMVKFIEPVALLLAGIFVMWFALAIFSVVMQITKSAWIG